MKKILFSALVGAMIISCSRDNDNTNPTTPQTPNQSIILPKKLIHSTPNHPDEVSTLNYNGDKLKEIVFSDGGKIEITYTGDLITFVKNEDGETSDLRYTNGILTSEIKKVFYPNGTIKNQMDYVYSYNGSEVIARVVEAKYNQIGIVQYKKTAVVTYTLDAQKRPTKIVEQEDTFDGSNNKTSEYSSTETFVYTSHQNLLKDIKGIDKLYHSHFMLTDMDELYNKNISEHKINATNITISGGNRYPLNTTNEFKYRYTTNANNYPLKQEESHKDPSTGGVFVDSQDYTTIEY